MTLSSPIEPAGVPASPVISCEAGPLTVYYDGACPLCSIEIRHYAGQAGAERLCFVDASASGAETGPGLPRADAMKRFHVRQADGRLLSGAAAFIAIWERLPAWRWAARLARLPGVTAVLEFAYRLFLPVRPLLSRLAGRMLRLGRR
jgi:predicted DCC family thiol-disulfide oxidoreductase YuxK